MRIMEDAVSAEEANRNFAQILRRVREGRSYVVTSRGRPVARIVPVEPDRRIAAAAKESLMNRLRSQPVRVIGHRWSRDDLYSD